MKIRTLKATDNSQIDAFAMEATLLIEQWNNLNAQASRGRLVLRLEGGNKKCPRKAVRLLVDTGRPSRPIELTLLLVEHDEEAGLVGSNPTLRAFGQQPMSIERLRQVIEGMDIEALKTN
jgi:hypothetical protein